MNKFILYWLTGKAEIIEGRNITLAFRSAGYSGGALRALDFYDNGEEIKYHWDKETNQWLPNPQEGIEQEKDVRVQKDLEYYHRSDKLTLIKYLNNAYQLGLKDAKDAVDKFFQKKALENEEKKG